MVDAIFAIVASVLKVVEVIAPKIPFTPAEKREQYRLNAERNYREWKRKLEKRRLENVKKDISKGL